MITGNFEQEEKRGNSLWISSESPSEKSFLKYRKNNANKKDQTLYIS